MTDALSQLRVAFLLSFVFIAAMALSGRRPYRELHGFIRQTLGAMALITILALVVFMPVTSMAESDVGDPEHIWFPILLIGHVLITAFLLIWWALRWRGSLAEFLHLTVRQLADQIRLGVTAGSLGWVLTVAVASSSAALVGASVGLQEPTQLPPIMVWLANLPLAYKLTIIGAAMLVEEAFFRGFLQPRFGIWVASVLFALAHFSYGLPFLVVGVFTFSLVVGYTFARSGQLLPCIVAHGIFDGVQLLVVLPLVVRWWPAPALG